MKTCSVKETIDVNIARMWDVFQALFGAVGEKKRLYYELMGSPKGSSVLDFGCATGVTAGAFSNCDYLGVDINKSYISLAQKKYKKWKNIQFLCCNAFELKDKKFDNILIAATGHHINDDDMVRILEKLKGMLKQGGKIHFIDIVKTKEMTFITRILMAIDKGEFIRTPEAYDLLLKRAEGLLVQDRQVVCADRFYAKPVFAYYRLSPAA